jgi:hypothetical protein
MTQFGQASHASDYSPIPITEIAKGYKDGTLTTHPLVAAKYPPAQRRIEGPLRGGVALFSDKAGAPPSRRLCSCR